VPGNLTEIWSSRIHHGHHRLPWNLHNAQNSLIMAPTATTEPIFYDGDPYDLDPRRRRAFQ
jgi:hypothetical protein